MMRQQRLVALCGLGGGALIAAGSLQPWFSLFAGLQPYAGTVGVYGRILLGVGLLVCALSALMLWRTRAMSVTRAASLLSVLGVITLTFAIWIAYGLQQKMAELEANPMLVAEYGAGVPLVLLGAIVLTASALLAGPFALPSALRIALPFARTTRGRGRTSGLQDRPSPHPSRAK